jgi:hypothetical protein
MTEIAISLTGRVMIDGVDVGCVEDASVNWPQHAAEIAVKKAARDAAAPPGPPLPPPIEIPAHDPSLPSVPTRVMATQAKIALLRAGRFDAVRAAVDRYPAEVGIWFSDATEWERFNPYVVGIGLELGLSENDMDDLFHAAQRIA